PARRGRGLPLRSAAASQKPASATVPAAMCRARKLAYPGMAAAPMAGDSSLPLRGPSPQSRRSPLHGAGSHFLRRIHCIAGTGRRSMEHRPRRRAMRGHLSPLMQPLNIAALLTLLTVAVSIHGELGSLRPLAWALLAGYSAIFLMLDALAGRPLLHAVGYIALAAIALAVVALAPRTGTSPVLLVILVAALAIDYPPSRVLPAAVLLNLALYLVLRAGGHAAPALTVTVYLGFQAFAALVAHYARSAEQARDRLALVNADLLATRALLADSARDAERLRFARELHDVAGHKLTALTLNLRALAERQQGGAPAELEVSRRLAAELMDDLRELVQQLRDDRGLDLATALRALAAPLPRPALQLAIDDDVRIS